MLVKDVNDGGTEVLLNELTTLAASPVLSMQRPLKPFRLVVWRRRWNEVAVSVQGVTFQGPSPTFGDLHDSVYFDSRNFGTEYEVAAVRHWSGKVADLLNHHDCRFVVDATRYQDMEAGMRGGEPEGVRRVVYFSDDHGNLITPDPAGFTDYAAAAVYVSQFATEARPTYRLLDGHVMAFLQGVIRDGCGLIPQAPGGLYCHLIHWDDLRQSPRQTALRHAARAKEDR